MKFRLVLMILALGMAWPLAVPAALPAQNIVVDSRQTRLLLAAQSTDTMQKELEKAGALGFHATHGTTRGSAEMVVLLERTLGTAQKLQFRLIATSATGTFRNEINQAAAQGYRAVGPTFLNKPAGIAGNEIVVVMERPVMPAKRYEYKLLAASQTSTLQSEWIAAAGEGYAPVGFLTRNEVMLLLEREVK